MKPFLTSCAELMSMSAAGPQLGSGGDAGMGVPLVVRSEAVGRLVWLAGRAAAFCFLRPGFGVAGCGLRMSNHPPPLVSPPQFSGNGPGGTDS